jgi:hypothetical protein
LGQNDLRAREGPRQEVYTVIIRPFGALLTALCIAGCGGEDAAEEVGPPMGKHVVYVAATSTGQRDGLYLLDTADPGRVIARLNPELRRGQYIRMVSPSPDGTRIAVVVGAEAFDGYDELHILDPWEPGRSLHVSTDRWYIHNTMRWAGDWLLVDAEVDTSFGTLPFFSSDYWLLAIDANDPARQISLFRSDFHADTQNGLRFDTHSLALGDDGAFVYRVVGGLFRRAAPDQPAQLLAPAADVATVRAVDASPDGAWLVLRYGDRPMRALRSDGTGGLIDLPRGSLSHVTNTGVVLADVVFDGPQPGQLRLFHVAFATPTVLTELTPATLEGTGVQYIRLSPDATQVAYVNGPSSSAPSVHTVELATPGIATRRLATTATTNITGLDYAEGGASLLVTLLGPDRRVVRVGARADQGIMTLATEFSSGGDPEHVTVCDDGLTVVLRERAQFPPGTGGLPENSHWLSELQAGRADTPGTRRITPGLPELRGVTAFACLPTRAGE